MLLPPEIFIQVHHHVPHHRCWHVARQPAQEVLRAKFPGETRPELAGLDEVGSGSDFLAFHRRMMRHFEFVLAAAHSKTFKFTRWEGARLPAWVEAQLLKEFPRFDLPAAYQTISSAVADGSIETLGGFIEPNYQHLKDPGAGLHNCLHAAIGAMERELFPGDTTAEMSDIGTAPCNVFFWTLHGWIDDLYRACQKAAGQTADHTPAHMEMVEVSCQGGTPPLLLP